MPVRRQDAERAVRLLEGYRSGLGGGAEDRQQLRGSLERVIGVFRSTLFRALLDIQEFYEATLLENPKTVGRPRPLENAPPLAAWDLSPAPLPATPLGPRPATPTQGHPARIPTPPPAAPAAAQADELRHLRGDGRKRYGFPPLLPISARIPTAGV
nr:disks large homolog 1-like [Anolis sagrei ordinatus]